MSNPNGTILTCGPYLLLEELGSGSFAKVYRCEHCRTHQKFAGKLYNLDFAISEQGYVMIKKEVSILKLLRGPNVVHFQEAVYTPSGVLVVMELVEGRTLLNMIPTSGGLPERFARPVFRQVLEALFFLHYNGIVHRDLKLENVMIDNDGCIKLIDFGLANYVPKGVREKGLLIKNRCGSPHYYAPEMILAAVNEKFQGDKVDIWAAGVLLYCLVTGFHPFHADEDKELFDQIVRCELLYDTKLSRELQDLLRSMLIKDPAKRSSLKEIRDHPWVNNTILAARAGSWLNISATQASVAGSESNASLEVADRQHRTRSCDVKFPKASHTASKASLTPREVGSVQKRTSSTEAVDGEQCCDSDREERQNRDARESKESKTSDTFLRHSSPPLSNRTSRRIGWGKVKACVKRVFCKKFYSIEEARTTDSEIVNLTSYAHRNFQRQLSQASEEVSKASVDGAVHNRRTPRSGKSNSARLSPFWKVSFVCWGNL